MRHRRGNMCAQYSSHRWELLRSLGWWLRRRFAASLPVASSVGIIARPRPTLAGE